MDVLVRPPAQEAGAMAEPPAGDMVVTHLRHQPVAQRYPFAAPLRRPAAGTAGRIAGKAWAAFQRFQFAGEGGAVLIADAGREPDMIELAVAIEQAQQQRADLAGPAGITKAPDHAVRGLQMLY